MCGLVFSCSHTYVKTGTRYYVGWGHGGSIHQGLSCFLFIATDQWPATEYIQNKPSRSLPGSSRISDLKVSGREKNRPSYSQSTTRTRRNKSAVEFHPDHIVQLLTADKLIIIHSGHVARMDKRNRYIVLLGRPCWKTILGYLNSGLVGKIMGQWILDSRKYGWTVAYCIHCWVQWQLLY
jgi:hypothetical protein